MKSTVIKLKCIVNPRVNWKIAISRVNELNPKLMGLKKRSLTAPVGTILQRISPIRVPISPPTSVP